MKKLLFIAGFAFYAILNFGSNSNSSGDFKKSPCPYVQQMKDSYLKGEEFGKSDCPYLNDRTPQCPFLNEDSKKSEIGECPYSGKNGINNSKSNQKIKLLEIKIS